MKIRKEITAWDGVFEILPSFYIHTKPRLPNGFTLEFRWLTFGIGWWFYDFFILNSFFHGIKERLKGSELPVPDDGREWFEAKN